MDIYVALASVLISLSSLVLSIFALLRSTSLSYASLEHTINERLNSTKEKIIDVTILMSDITCKLNPTPDERKKLECLNAVLQTTFENHLNAMEIACSNYRDRKIDVKRFKKNYHIELRQLFENEQFKKYLDTKKAGFECIKKVYSEWNDLEKD